MLSGTVDFADNVNPPNPYGGSNNNRGASDMWFCSYTNGGYSVSTWTGYDIPNTSPQMPSYYTGQKDICLAVQKYLNGEREVPDAADRGAYAYQGGYFFGNAHNLAQNVRNDQGHLFPLHWFWLSSAPKKQKMPETERWI